YYDYNGDGWRDKPDGTSFDFTILGPAEDDLTPFVMAGNIASWMQSVGINVELISNTSDVHLTDIEADNFDMFLFTENRGDIDPQFLGDMFLSDGIATNDNLLNFMPIVESVNESLDSKIDNTTFTCNLNNTNIVGTPIVYHNSTILTTSGYEIDTETGVFTLDSDSGVDLAFDFVNITYSSLAFDQIMKKANAEMDPDMRANYIKEAQGLVSELMPEIPLFSFRVNHAYNSSGFIGWTQTLGGLNNFWSFTNLRNSLNEGNMDVSISIPLAVSEDGILGGEETSLQIKVENIDGTALSGVDLAFDGEGTFGTPTYDVSTGGYTASYIAPETESTRTVTITINAAKVSEGSGSGTIDITVRSLTNEFTVEISKGESSIPSGNETTVSFIVLDKVTKAAVPEADLTLSISPSGLGGYLDNYSGITDAAGEYTVTFGADNVTIDTTFRITAKINKDSYSEAEKSTSINVVKMETEAPDRGFLGLPAPSMILVLLAFAGLALVIRKRKY
ncbi:MAG: hypothetical protein KAS67_04720, partial [Thermoplasmata archaeon]|nr:hypothetical protein [Thermoplasmata archaeon]